MSCITMEKLCCEYCFLKLAAGIPAMTQWLRNPTSIHEDSSSIPCSVG